MLSLNDSDTRGEEDGGELLRMGRRGPGGVPPRVFALLSNKPTGGGSRRESMPLPREGKVALARGDASKAKVFCRGEKSAGDGEMGEIRWANLES